MGGGAAQRFVRPFTWYAERKPNDTPPMQLFLHAALT